MASYFQQQDWRGAEASGESAPLRGGGDDGAVVHEEAVEKRWTPARIGLVACGILAAVLLTAAMLRTPTDHQVQATHAAVITDASSTGHSTHESSRHSRSSHTRHHKSRRHGSKKDDDDEDKEETPSVAQPEPVTPVSPPSDATSSSSGAPSKKSKNDTSVINTNSDCAGPFPGYPYCQDKVAELRRNWMVNPEQEAYYRSKGVDGTQCSFLTYLNLNGFYCPEAADTNKVKIRGVNLGGWLVLEPWIVPSLFEQFPPKRMIQDHWTFCEELGKKECLHQLEKHWDTWVTEDDLIFLAKSGINHLRVPFGYWMFGDIRVDEPWVNGELPYLERVIGWAAKLEMHVVLDLHCAPGSQNGFDNSGRKGEVHFADEVHERYGRVVYPNIRRALEVIANVTSHFSQPQFVGTVVGIELVNEAFVTIPLEVVKDYYLQGYEIVKAHGDTMAVIIGDSFRFGAWNDFMFPPHYRHVWIDTHIYQMFDSSRLSMTWSQHLTQTCHLNKPEVAVAPLSTMVGEWSLATTDCAKWLNSYGSGARFDGTFPGGQQPTGSCVGQDDLTNTTIWTPEYRSFLLQYSSKQMDAYESGSSEGWFFWNFKTEKGAFQWNYMLGVKEGWIPSDLNNRPYKC